MAILNISKKKSNLSPGTLRYTGQYSTEHTTIDVIKYNNDECIRTDITDISQLNNNDNYVQWVNIIGLNDELIIEKMGEMFNVHRTNLEDIMDVSQRSKFEINDHYLFSIFKMFYLEKTTIISEHVSIIIHGNLLFTFQEKPGDIFDLIRDRLVTNQGPIRKMGVDYLFFSLVDRLVDLYFNSLQFLEDRFTEIEASIIGQNNTNMDEIYQIRKDLIYLRNGIGPVKDILQNIVRMDDELFSGEVKKYFADVYDNSIQIFDTVSTYREMVNGLYEAQAAKRNDDINKKIMTLTIISVIFIPLSFLTGVFGMNFLHMPMLSYEYSFIIFVSTCIFIVSFMLYILKKKKWF